MGGIFSSVLHQLSGKTEKRILMMGPEGAGKSSMLYRVAPGRFNVEFFEYKNLEFTIWDVGGQALEKTRVLWEKNYLPNTHGVVYVVDSNDRDRIELARCELHRLLQEEDLRDAALLVFANKQDLPQAMTRAEMTEALGLSGLERSRNWHIQACCAINGDGFYEGLDWISTTLEGTADSVHIIPAALET